MNHDPFGEDGPPPSLMLECRCCGHGWFQRSTANPCDPLRCPKCGELYVWPDSPPQPDAVAPRTETSR